MKNSTVISIDGRWDHKRRGKSCIVVKIDQSQKKIINFEITRWSAKTYPIDYSRNPQSMETEYVKRISERLKNNMKIIGYVHDRDLVFFIISIQKVCNDD